MSGVCFKIIQEGERDRETGREREGVGNKSGLEGRIDEASVGKS